MKTEIPNNFNATEEEVEERKNIFRNLKLLDFDL
jgi:hypothetical protein